MLDTRDLAEEREELKAQVFESFIENFPQYEEMTSSFDDIRFEEEEIQSWKEDWEGELSIISDIDYLEENLSEFDFGVTLIPEDDFVDYCEELLKELGVLPSNLPWYISNHIDWEGVAGDIKQDYSEIEYQGQTYLYR